PKRNVVPDRLDLRDRPYVPGLHEPPPPVMVPQLKLPMLDQGTTNACTGFALASVVNVLLRKHRDPKTPPMSPFMLYSMARRYDEFPGAAEDSGSTLRADAPVAARLGGPPLRWVPGRRRGLRLEPARRHEGLVQARRLSPRPLGPPGHAPAGGEARGRLVAGRGPPPPRRLLSGRHPIRDGYARGPARRRCALRERHLPRRLAPRTGRRRGQGVRDDPAEGGGGPRRGARA